jgi:hypothetical protein
MPDVLLSSGEAEVFKLGWHRNAMAWSERRERHLATNAVVYAGLAYFEVQQMSRHMAHLRGA